MTNNICNTCAHVARVLSILRAERDAVNDEIAAESAEIVLIEAQLQEAEHDWYE